MTQVIERGEFATMLKVSFVIVALTLARGVVVRPLDDAPPVEVLAVPRPQRKVLRAAREAVADDLLRRRARLGKRTRARKLSPHVRTHGLGTTGFARNPVFSLFS